MWNIIVLSTLVFIVRFILIFFGYTIGIMPYLKDDILFYSLLALFGVLFTIFYLTKIEKKTFEEVGWEIKDIRKNVIFGLLSFIPLILMIPLLIILTGIQVVIQITWEKIILGICFGLLLAGIFEETMFRGIIQNDFMELTTEKKTVLLTTIVFTATHIGYLPFDGYGIYYIFVFIMALLLSILRLKLNLLSCYILHGGIVFILIIFV
ncbi:MAG: CPBP family glutamic-type intramembrane protease [Candidatus Helarchaeota archaeon]